MAAINEGVFIGKVTKEPVIKYLGENHIPFFECVIQIKRPNSNNIKDLNKQSDFISVIAWNEDAEKYYNEIRKGDMVLVEGRFQSRNIERENKPSDEQHNELIELFLENQIEKRKEVLENILTILELDGRKSTHMQYQISALNIKKIDFNEDLYMNKLTLLGKLVQEPEFKYVKNSKGEMHPLWKGYIAVNRPFNQHANDDDKKADYIHLVDWGEEAEACNAHTQNKSQIALVGKIYSRNFIKINQPEVDQYNKLLDFIKTLDIDDKDSFMEKVLEIFNLNEKKVNNVAYEVSISHVEFLNNCIFD
ncbi:MAG: single-stranded DNA-binding protein [Candidatus Woesearchaeota archaeon]